MGSFPPRTNQAGRLYTSVGDGSDAGKWAEAGSGIIRVTKTYMLIGPLTAHTFPPLSIAVPESGSVALVGVVGETSAGTVTADLKWNGTSIGGLSAISLSTTSTCWVYPSSPVEFADLETIVLILSSPSGTGDLVLDLAFDIAP